jgi:hypothetical protein
MSLCLEVSDVAIGQQPLLFHQLRRGFPRLRLPAGQLKGLAGAFAPAMLVGRAPLLALPRRLLAHGPTPVGKISHIMSLRRLRSEGAVAHLLPGNAIFCAA